MQRNMPLPSSILNVTGSGHRHPQWKAEVIAWALDIDKHTNAHFLLREQYNLLSKERVENLFHRIWFIENRKGANSKVLFSAETTASRQSSTHGGDIDMSWHGRSWHERGLDEENSINLSHSTTSKSEERARKLVAELTCQTGRRGPDVLSHNIPDPSVFMNMVDNSVHSVVSQEGNDSQPGEVQYAYLPSSRNTSSHGGRHVEQQLEQGRDREWEDKPRSMHGGEVLPLQAHSPHHLHKSSRHPPISSPGRGVKGGLVRMDTNAPTPFAPFLSIPILHTDTREGESIRMDLSGKATRLPPPVEILSQSGHGRHSSFVDDSSMISGELAGLTDLPGTHGQHWEKKFKGFLESASVIEPKQMAPISASGDSSGLTEAFSGTTMSASATFSINSDLANQPPTFDNVEGGESLAMLPGPPGAKDGMGMTRLPFGDGRETDLPFEMNKLQFEDTSSESLMDSNGYLKTRRSIDTPSNELTSENDSEAFTDDTGVMNGSTQSSQIPCIPEHGVDGGFALGVVNSKQNVDVAKGHSFARSVLLAQMNLMSGSSDGLRETSEGSLSLHSNTPSHFSNTSLEAILYGNRPEPSADALGAANPSAFAGNSKSSMQMRSDEYGRGESKIDKGAFQAEAVQHEQSSEKYSLGALTMARSRSHSGSNLSQLIENRGPTRMIGERNAVEYSVTGGNSGASLAESGVVVQKIDFDTLFSQGLGPPCTVPMMCNVDVSRVHNLSIPVHSWITPMVVDNLPCEVLEEIILQRGIFSGPDACTDYGGKSDGMGLSLRGDIYGANDGSEKSNSATGSTSELKASLERAAEDKTAQRDAWVVLPEIGSTADSRGSMPLDSSLQSRIMDHWLPLGLAYMCTSDSNDSPTEWHLRLLFLYSNFLFEAYLPSQLTHCCCYKSSRSTGCDSGEASKIEARSACEVCRYSMRFIGFLHLGQARVHRVMAGLPDFSIHPTQKTARDGQTPRGEGIHVTRRSVSQVPVTMRPGNVLCIKSYVTSDIPGSGSDHQSSPPDARKSPGAKTTVTFIALEKQEDLAVLERAVRNASCLTVEDLYRFDTKDNEPKLKGGQSELDGAATETLLGKGRFNVVRKARKIHPTKLEENYHDTSMSASSHGQTHGIPTARFNIPGSPPVRESRYDEGEKELSLEHGAQPRTRVTPQEEEREGNGVWRASVECGSSDSDVNDSDNESGATWRDSTDKGSPVQRGRPGEPAESGRSPSSNFSSLSNLAEECDDSGSDSSCSDDPHLGQCALKIINKSTFWGRVVQGREKPDSLVREVLAQALLSQGRDFYQRNPEDPPPPPFVLENFPIAMLYGIFETAQEFILELELMREHDLFEELRAKGKFTESQASGIVLQVTEAIHICHLHNIAHRDVKLGNITFPMESSPEAVEQRKAEQEELDFYKEYCPTQIGSSVPEVRTNGNTMLLAAKSSGSANPTQSDLRDAARNHYTPPRVPIFIKLLDLGMAGFNDSNKMISGRCGTPGYAAPEVLKAGQDVKYPHNVDMFSLGVVAYTLLCGYEPFFGCNDQELMLANRNIEYEFHSPEWDEISTSAKDFISRTICPAHMRMTPYEAKLHPWLRHACHNSDMRMLGRMRNMVLKMGKPTEALSSSLHHHVGPKNQQMTDRPVTFAPERALRAVRYSAAACTPRERQNTTSVDYNLSESSNGSESSHVSGHFLSSLDVFVRPDSKEGRGVTELSEADERRCVIM